MIQTSRWGWAALLLALAGGAAQANERVFEYTIQHPVFGEIGTYTNHVKAAGDRTEVNTTVEVAVNVAGSLIYRQNATRHEKWSGERLVAFSSVTQTNEERLEVRGQAEGDDFVLTTPQGVVTAPAGVRPTNPWSLAIVKAEMLIAPMSGRLFRARITDREEILPGRDGRARTLRRYEIVGDKRQVVWFDEAGVPLAFRSEEGGVNIDFVLNLPPGSDTVPGPTRPQRLGANLPTGR